MKKAINIIIPILICFLIGFISANFFQAESIANWYPLLKKPPLTPPKYIFPIAWSTLYVLMGISIGIILNLKTEVNKRYFINLFALQLLLNFTWSISFFYLQNPILGFINIVLLNMVIIFYTIKSYKISKISALLFCPYILWVSFASYLNLYIVLNN